MRGRAGLGKARSLHPRLDWAAGELVACGNWKSRRLFLAGNRRFDRGFGIERQLSA